MLKTFPREGKKCPFLSQIHLNQEVSMRKAVFTAMLLASTIFLLGCSGGNIVGPMSDNYDHAKLFKVRVTDVIAGGFVEVEVAWLAQKMDQGGHPISFGPLDPDWTYKLKTPLNVKSDDGLYYVYRKICQAGMLYHVGACLDWTGTDIHSNAYIWLAPSEQAGSAYYDYRTGYQVMAFTAYSDYTVKPGF
jgi:hypothetical protein